MNTEQVWYQMVKKRSDDKRSGIQMPFEYQTAQPFEHLRYERQLVSYVWVQYLNGWAST